MHFSLVKGTSGCYFFNDITGERLTWFRATLDTFGPHFGYTYIRLGYTHLTPINKSECTGWTLTRAGVVGGSIVVEGYGSVG